MIISLKHRDYLKLRRFVEQRDFEAIRHLLQQKLGRPVPGIVYARNERRYVEVILSGDI